jgi:hypothetical protein
MVGYNNGSRFLTLAFIMRQSPSDVARLTVYAISTVASHKLPQKNRLEIGVAVNKSFQSKIKRNLCVAEKRSGDLD